MPLDLTQLLLISFRNLAVWLVVLAAVFVPLERAFAVHRQPAIRPQLIVDIGYYFLTGIIPTVILAVPLAAIAAMARQIVPQDYYLWIAAWPTGFQIIAAFAVGELGFYWGHRAMHEMPGLWRFHAIHHQPTRMDWLINSRAHPIDIIFTRMCGLTLVVVAGFGSPGSGSGSLIPIIVLIGGTFWSFFIHSNISWRVGWLEPILSTPHFHHWHHSRDDHVNHNYASILPVYDLIFGSYHSPRGQWPPSYGIAPQNRPEVLLAERYPELEAKDDGGSRETAA